MKTLKMSGAARRLFLGVCSVALLGLTTPGQSAHAEGYACPTAMERAAMGLRAMQSQLMVAALSCGETERYNQFVRQFNVPLADHGAALRRHFEKTYGARSEHQLNRFVTRLANVASTDSATRKADFCAAGASLYSRILKADPARLIEVASRWPVAGYEHIDACNIEIEPAGEAVARNIE